MKYGKIILSALISLSFLAMLILPSFLNMCIPDGCTFTPNVCSDGNCFNETVGQHLNEKSQLFTAIIKLQSLVIFIAIVFLFLAVKNYTENENSFFVKFYAKRAVIYSYSNMNYLIEAFSNGIVNPKIY